MLASESIATAGTKTIDVNIKKPISRITVRVKGTNNGSTPTAHPALIVSKMELVDGSDVLFSLSGKECYALNFHEEGELPFTINETEDNIQCCATYHLNFGRKLWDEVLALNPGRFNNLQLKITHDKAAGGSAPDAGTLAVFAHVFDEGAPSPRGFLMSKEVFTYTLTASAHERITLPVDFDYRHILVMSHSNSLAPYDQYNKIKFTLDNDADVLINDVSTSDLIKVFQEDDKIEESFATLGTGSAVAYFLVSSYEQYAVGVGRSASQTTIIVAQPSGSGINVTNDSSESVAVNIDGYCPFGALNIMMVDKMDVANWFDPRGHKSVELDLTAGSSASGTVQIITQQLRTY